MCNIIGKHKTSFSESKAKYNLEQNEKQKYTRLYIH